MSEQLQGWIDDPGDPWVGFVMSGKKPHVERPRAVGGPRLKKEFSKGEVFVRVRAQPEPALADCFLPGEPVHRVHEQDVELLTGRRMHNVFVCRHMGRFVE